LQFPTDYKGEGAKAPFSFIFTGTVLATCKPYTKLSITVRLDFSSHRLILVNIGVERNFNMKLAEVKIGEIYKTEVSGKMVDVKVLFQTKDYYSSRKKFKVVRVDNHRILDKLRSAAKLSPID